MQVHRPAWPGETLFVTYGGATLFSFATDRTAIFPVPPGHTAADAPGYAGADAHRDGHGTVSPAAIRQPAHVTVSPAAAIQPDTHASSHRVTGTVTPDGRWRCRSYGTATGSAGQCLDRGEFARLSQPLRHRPREPGRPSMPQRLEVSGRRGQLVSTTVLVIMMGVDSA
jgi:hypothetical protein